MDMTRQRMGGVWVFLLITACTAPLWADPITDFCHSVVQDVKRRNCWPKPFMYSDRQAAREPFALMVNNGWQRQNVLMDIHFESGGTQLSEAGRRKVLDILNVAPAQHRAIYVYRAATPQDTAIRIGTVQQFVAQSAYQGQVAPIFESNRPDEGWPAEQVEMVNRKFQAAMPNPTLSAAGGGGSGSSGGSSGH
jgi:hypothetical protein